MTKIIGDRNKSKKYLLLYKLANLVFNLIFFNFF